MPEQGNNLRVRYPEIAKELDQSDDAQVEKFVTEVVAEQKEIHVQPEAIEMHIPQLSIHQARIDVTGRFSSTLARE